LKLKKEIKKLNNFRKWFDRFIKKNYGRRCPDFVWSCHACHAHFVKDLLDDFIEDTIETEKWFEKPNQK